MPDEPVLHSRRSLTLKFDIPISKTREFWGFLKEGKFVTTKCTKCGAVTFPPQADCPRCMSSQIEWTELEGDATLVTFTYVQITPASFVESDPYIVAIGEFRGGVKALAWLEGVGLEGAKPGMKLRIEARGVETNNPYYVFVPG